MSSIHIAPRGAERSYCGRPVRHTFPYGPTCKRCERIVAKKVATPWIVGMQLRADGLWEDLCVGSSTSGNSASFRMVWSTSLGRSLT